ALTPWPSRVLMTSCCVSALPGVGILKSSSTSSSSAAFSAPFWAMLQKFSGLLLTKATRGLPEEPLHPIRPSSDSVAAAQTRQWSGFIDASFQGESKGGPANGPVESSRVYRGRGRRQAAGGPVEVVLRAARAYNRGMAVILVEIFLS